MTLMCTFKDNHSNPMHRAPYYPRHPLFSTNKQEDHETNNILLKWSEYSYGQEGSGHVSFNIRIPCSKSICN